MKRVFLGSRDKSISALIRAGLGPQYHLEAVSAAGRILSLFRQERYEFLFIDLDFLGELTPPTARDDYGRALQLFWNIFPTVPIIVLSSQERIRDAVSVVKAGAATYLTYPIEPDELLLVIDNLEKTPRTKYELDYLRDAFWQRESILLLRTVNREMKTLFNKIRSVAPTKSTVLIMGETGTGKNVMARLIHGDFTAASMHEYIWLKDKDGGGDRCCPEA